MSRPRPLVLVLTAGVLALTGCTSADPAQPSAEASTAAASAGAAAGTEHVEFTYAGAEGPEHWGELADDFATCADGTAQSPIDLTDATAVQVPDLALDYGTAGVVLTDNGHTVQADEEPGAAALTVDGHVYELAQFHLHEPAEHTVDGTTYDAELHLVHKDAGGAIAVVGVLLTVGAENEALAPYFDALPTQVGATAEVPALDLAAVLPTDRSSYRYSGSLTTPPCTEGVSWFVLATPVEVSADQLAAFRSVIEPNNRPVQDGHGRELVLDATD